MGYERISEIRLRIRHILADKDYMSKIEACIKQNKRFSDVSYLEFRRSLSFITTITDEEYFWLTNSYLDNEYVLEDIYDYIFHLDKNREEGVFEDSFIAVSTINFIEYTKDIRTFINTIRLDKKRKKQETEAQLEEIKRILEEIQRYKNDIERILNSIGLREKESTAVVEKLKYSESKITELVDNVNRQRKEIEEILLRSQIYRESFDNQKQALKLRMEELKSLIDEYDAEVKSRINKRIEVYENDLKESFKQFSEKCDTAFANNEEYFNDKREELLKNLYKEQTTVTDTILAFKAKVLKDLREIESNVYREQLARYFYDERRKLKGDINFNLIVVSIAAFIVYWNKELFSIQIKDPIFIAKMVVYYLGFLVFTQIVFNIHNTFKLKNIIKILFNPKSIITTIIASLDDKDDAEKDDDARDNSIIEKIFFQRQVKDLLTPYWCWLAATFSGMASIGYLAFNIFKQFDGKPVSYSDFLPFTAGYMLLIWVTWFCSKQFSYTKQICDEYEYKYALSKSYISYREEAKKLADAKQNVAIMISLLDSIIKNIAQSPVQSVRRDCHTPFTEVFNAVKDAGKACSSVKDNDKLND